MEAHAPDGLEGAQALNDVGMGLLDHVNVGADDPQNRQNHNGEHNILDEIHTCTS